MSTSGGCLGVESSVEEKRNIHDLHLGSDGESHRSTPARTLRSADRGRV